MPKYRLDFIPVQRGDVVETGYPAGNGHIIGFDNDRLVVLVNEADPKTEVIVREHKRGPKMVPA
jgi:hypothetical protein